MNHMGDFSLISEDLFQDMISSLEGRKILLSQGDLEFGIIIIPVISPCASSSPDLVGYALERFAKIE
jgi:hypothetical protein